MGKPKIVYKNVLNLNEWPTNFYLFQALHLTVLIVPHGIIVNNMVKYNDVMLHTYIHNRVTCTLAHIHIIILILFTKLIAYN